MDNKEIHLATTKSIFSEHSSNIKKSSTIEEVNSHLEKLDNIKSEVNTDKLDKKLVSELNKSVQQNINAFKATNQIAQNKIKKLNTKQDLDLKQDFDLVNHIEKHEEPKPIKQPESVKDEFEVILNGNDDLATLAKWLVEYNTINYKETKTNNDKVNKENYTKQLYFMLYNILKIEDKDEFIKRFDVVNMAFDKFSTQGFNIVKLYSNRFNYSWNNGEYDAFKSIVFFICNLANKDLRKANLKNIALNKFTLPKYQYNGKVIYNLITYYGEH